MKLGLGAVQFGQKYGITNTRGQPSEREITRILQRAAEVEWRILDTACDYGTSEDVLGRCLPSHTDFQIITKTPAFRKSPSTVQDDQRLTHAFQESLRKLKRTSLYALLIHHAIDLLDPRGDLLFEAMVRLKRQGLVQKIGVSVYSPEQAEKAMEQYPLDIIQFPLNVLDRRFTTGNFLHRMKQRHIEIYARSIFLQGVLLMDLSKLPSFLNPLREPLGRYRTLVVEQGLSLLQGALLHAFSYPELDCALVGVAGLDEFNDILHAVEGLPQGSVDWSVVPEPSIDFIDPSRWPATARPLP